MACDAELLDRAIQADRENDISRINCDNQLSFNGSNGFSQPPVVYDYDLPFEVIPLSWGEPADQKPKYKYSLAQRCLYPSELRYLDSVNKLEYVDFYKL